MIVLPPGLTEEEEMLQKKFAKLKKKVRPSLSRLRVARQATLDKSVDGP